MKKLIFNLTIALLTLMTINLSAQANAEEKRSEFLTKYYGEFHNETNKVKMNAKIDASNTNRSAEDIKKMKRRKKTSNISDDSRKLEAISKNCLNSLQNENKGVAESAIFVSIQFKNRYPETNDERFVEVLNELSQDVKNPIIAHKAHLAKMYFHSHELFESISIPSIEEEEKLYKEITNRISSTILASNYN